MDETKKLFITLTATAVIAVVGFFIKYFYDLELVKRKDRLDRVNKQLGDCYGPLYALLKSNDQAWISLKHRLAITDNKFDIATSTEAERKVWKHYMQTIYIPTNDKIYDILVSKSDLLKEEDIPDCLLQLITHIVAYKVVAKGWEVGEGDENVEIVPFPLNAREHVYQEFGNLKKEQSGLLSRNYYFFTRMFGK
ncbi:hypothetical protein LZD49_04725 [Dyadobacter sp. CY261]|uniref:hypothetical protein n=1 Tax=Dyadobacter sp. CY261 TaxID=2907203 RepID=UPI001F26EF93|nr:hypothetical protein [Dyadobacter sp. CY261]MCF0069764.1 hypothetical protein [Dyadobacter sp. CY261]